MGGQDQCSGVCLIQFFDVEVYDFVGGQVGQIFVGMYVVVGQCVCGGFVYVFQGQQVLCWLVVFKVFFDCQGFIEQCIVGMSVQFFDDVFVEIFYGQQFVDWDICDFFDGVEVFVDQDVGDFFVYFQFVYEQLVGGSLFGF